MNPIIIKILSKVWPFSIVMKKINGLYGEIYRLNQLYEEQIQKINELELKLAETEKSMQIKDDEIIRLSNINDHQSKALFENQQNLNTVLQENIRLSSLLKATEAKYIRLNSAEFWDSIYKQGGTSGTGSYGHLAQFKADIVNEFLKSNNIKTAIELGCGDGAQLSLIRYECYTGVDASPYIIEKLKEKYLNDSSKQFYCSLTERDKYIHKKYDVSISMDAIFHLLEDNVFANYMEDLFSLSNRYVIIYSSNHEEYTRWPEYRHRNFMGYIQQYISGWELEKFIPNKYPYVIGREEETSASDFYIFKKIS